jgi:hypothetical protein
VAAAQRWPSRPVPIDSKPTFPQSHATTPLQAHRERCATACHTRTATWVFLTQRAITGWTEFASGTTWCVPLRPLLQPWCPPPCRAVVLRHIKSLLYTTTRETVVHALSSARRWLSCWGRCLWHDRPSSPPAPAPLGCFDA